MTPRTLVFARRHKKVTNTSKQLTRPESEQNIAKYCQPNVTRFVYLYRVKTLPHYKQIHKNLRSGDQSDSFCRPIRREASCLRCRFLYKGLSPCRFAKFVKLVSQVSVQIEKRLAFFSVD